MKFRARYITVFILFIFLGLVNYPIFCQESQTENVKPKPLKSEDAFDSVKSESEFPKPPSPEIQAKKSRLFENAKRDIEAFRLFTKQLRRHNEMDDVELMGEVSHDFIEKYIDELLDQDKSSSHYETIRLEVVILFTKAMLYYELNDMDGVTDIMDQLKTNYSQYYDIAVNHFGYNLVKESIEKFEQAHRQETSAKKPGETPKEPESLSSNVKDLSNNIKDLSDNVKNLTDSAGGFTSKIKESIKEEEKQERLKDESEFMSDEELEKRFEDMPVM